MNLKFLEKYGGKADTKIDESFIFIGQKDLVKNNAIEIIGKNFPKISECIFFPRKNNINKLSIV
jgi:hypothetical protein